MNKKILIAAILLIGSVSAYPLWLIRKTSGGYGAELVTNGDFSGGSTGWTVETNWSVAAGVASASAVFGNANELWQSLSVTDGNTYEVTYTISNYSAGSLRFEFGASPNGTNRSANGTYTEQVVMSTDPKLEFRGATTFTGDIDDVSVREVL